MPNALSELENRMRKERDADQKQRYRIVLYTARGLTPSEVHHCLGASRTTVYRVVGRFVDEDDRSWVSVCIAAMLAGCYKAAVRAGGEPGHCLVRRPVNEKNVAVHSVYANFPQAWETTR